MALNQNVVLADVAAFISYSLQDRQVVITTHDNQTHYLTMSEWALFTHGPNPNPANLATENRKRVHDKTTYFDATGRELRKQSNDTLTVLLNRPVKGRTFVADDDEQERKSPVVEPDTHALAEVLGGMMHDA